MALCPVSTHPRSVLAACVRVAAASVPDAASVRARAASRSPRASAGTNRCFCSSLPNSKSARIAIEPCATVSNPSAGLPAESSAITLAAPNRDTPRPPSSAAYLEPEQPELTHAVEHRARGQPVPVELHGVDFVFAQVTHVLRQRVRGAAFLSGQGRGTGRGARRSISPKNSAFTQERDRGMLRTLPATLGTAASTSGRMRPALRARVDCGDRGFAGRAVGGGGGWVGGAGFGMPGDRSDQRRSLRPRAARWRRPGASPAEAVWASEQSTDCSPPGRARRTPRLAWLATDT